MELKTITDQKYAPLFCEWLNARFEGVTPADPADTRTIASVLWDPATEQSEIVAVTAFNRWTTTTAEVHIASDGSKRQKVNREYICTCFDFIFRHAGKECLVAHIAPENVKSLVVAEMLGLKQVAVLNDYYGEDKNAVLLTITKREWQQGPWAQKEVEEA